MAADVAAQEQQDSVREQAEREEVNVREAQEAANPGGDMPMQPVTSMDDAVIKEIQEEAKGESKVEEGDRDEKIKDETLEDVQEAKDDETKGEKTGIENEKSEITKKTKSKTIKSMQRILAKSKSLGLEIFQKIFVRLASSIGKD